MKNIFSSSLVAGKLKYFLYKKKKKTKKKPREVICKNIILFIQFYILKSLFPISVNLIQFN